VDRVSVFCPSCDATTMHECTRVTESNGSVVVEFRACEVCDTVV